MLTDRDRKVANILVDELHKYVIQLKDRTRRFELYL